MKNTGFKPCPECGSTEIDYGKSTKPNVFQVYAQCDQCKRIIWVPLYKDEWFNLRPADGLIITRDAWNRQIGEGDTDERLNKAVT